MDSRKRKAPIDIYRRVKVRKDVAESDDDGWDGVSNGSEVDERDGSGEDEEDGENQSEGQSEDDESSEEPEVDASSISFGALAKAQDSAPRPPKRRPGASPAAGQGRRHRPQAGDGSDSDSDGSDGSAGSGDELARTGRESGGRGAATTTTTTDKAAAAPKPKKKSKHAPEEASSKRRVSRYREVVTRLPNARPKARDPRFDHPGGDDEDATAADAARLRRNYAFLDEYRDAELRQMREALAASNKAAAAAAGGKKKRKRGGDRAPQLSPEEREELKRNIMAMENQNRARERKDRQEALLAEHRRNEKELVRQGKKPFYLKRSEQKKMLLMDQYASMTKGQVDKAIERKRKKVAGKEKKMLPFARRGAAEN
ncbi:hypothetical protein RB595_007476 [Gaeumannomyces hyphopodioides]